MKEKIKKILEAIGLGGLIIGGVGFSILQIIFVWGTGVGMVIWGISLLLEGSILWGLLVLFIGTPVAVAIASFLLPFWIILLLIYGIIWIIGKIF